MSSPLPIQRILGPVDLNTGAFGLLGLEPGPVTTEDVDRALSTALGKLARLSQGTTAEADEVRLALHVAAAQLRDPGVRDALLAQIRARGAIGGAAKGALDQLIVQLIAHSGGWNPLARKRVASVLHAYGCEISDMGAHVDHALKLHATQHRLAPAVHPDATPNTADADASQGTWTNAPVMYGMTLVLLVASALMTGAVLTMRLSADRPVRTNKVPEQARDDAAPAPVVPAGDGAKLGQTLSEQVESVSETLFGPDRMIASIRRAGQTMDQEPERSLASFLATQEEIGESWARWQWPFIIRASQETTDFIRDVARRWRDEATLAVESSVAAARALNASEPVAAQDVAPLVWSAGITNRLSRERALPDDLEQTIEDARLDLFPVAFEPVDRSFLAGGLSALERLGAGVVLSQSPSERPQELEAFWNNWMMCLRALSGEASEAGQAVLLRTIDRLLMEGPDVTLDVDTQIALRSLLSGVNWMPGGDGRRRLLDWFDARTIATSDLGTITSWLVANTREPGLNDLTPLHALSGNSDRAMRADVRDRYAESWSLALRPRSGRIDGRWVQAAHAALVQTDESARLVPTIQQTIRIALLNAVAAMRWESHDTRAMALLDDADSLFQNVTLQRTGDGAATTGARLLTAPAQADDGRWAASYRSARRDRALKEQLLRQLDLRAEPLGPADADTLIEVAYYGTPQTIRARAQQIVVKRADELAVVNALLEMIASAPRTRGVASMLEAVTGHRLPDPREPGFRRPARVALVQRLLEMLSTSEIGVVDSLELILASQYQLRTAPAGDGPQPPSGQSASVAAATNLRGVWRSRADQAVSGRWTYSSIARLDRRRDARIQLAQGPIQLFAAEQVSIAELMALVISAEYASQQSRIDAILEDMAQERRKATSVFGQLLAAERAMLRLWMVRFGENEEGAQ